MIKALHVLAALNLVGGLLGFVLFWPDTGYSGGSLPAVLYALSAANFVYGVVGFVGFMVVAEVLGHVRAIRAHLVPVAAPEAVFTTSLDDAPVRLDR